MFSSCKLMYTYVSPRLVWTLKRFFQHVSSKCYQLQGVSPPDFLLFSVMRETYDARPKNVIKTAENRPFSATTQTFLHVRYCHMYVQRTISNIGNRRYGRLLSYNRRISYFICHTSGFVTGRLLKITAGLTLARFVKPQVNSGGRGAREF